MFTSQRWARGSAIALIAAMTLLGGVCDDGQTSMAERRVLHR